MDISNESGMRKIDIDLVKFFFTAKTSTLEELEDHASGMFSTQQDLMELQQRVLSFMLAQRNRNSIFYLFLNKVKLENLRIVVNTVIDLPDDLTKEYAMVLDEDLTDLKVYQRSVSGQILTLVSL